MPGGAVVNALDINWDALDINWDALSYKPDCRMGAAPPIQYDFHVRYTRYVEMIADKCWSFELREFFFMKGYGWAQKEYEDAVLWAGVQDAIAEREESRRWHVEVFNHNRLSRAADTSST